MVKVYLSGAVREGSLAFPVAERLELPEEALKLNKKKSETVSLKYLENFTVWLHTIERVDENLTGLACLPSRLS